MTTTTVYGRVSKLNEPAADYGKYGNLLKAHAYESFAMTLENRVPVDIDHDERSIGQVVHVELDKQDALQAVAVLDVDPARFTDLDQPVYFSGTFLTDTSSGNGTVWNGRHAQLLGLSLTHNPMTLGQPPVRFLPGDVRSSFDRGRWPHDPLLMRAGVVVECRSAGSRLQVIDLLDQPWSQSTLPEIELRNRYNANQYV